MSQQTQQTKKDLEKLLALSGMAFHQGKTTEHWKELTGVDPKEVPEVQIRNNLCYWTQTAEKIAKAHFQQTKNSWYALGISA